jgi:phage terminase small subunit
MGVPAKPAQLKLLTGRRPGVDAGGRKVNEGRGRTSRSLRLTSEETAAQACVAA